MDDQLRMIVTLYLELADGNVVFPGRARVLGNCSDAGRPSPCGEPVGDVASSVENLGGLPGTTAAPHEYFDEML